MALMDHLNIDKFPLCVGSGAGVIGIRMAIQYPDRIQALCMFCATTGGYTHPLDEMFAKETGKSVMESPTFAFYAIKYAPRFFATGVAA